MGWGLIMVKIAKLAAMALLLVIVLLASISVVINYVIRLFSPNTSLPTEVTTYPMPHVYIVDIVPTPPNLLSIYIENSGSVDGVIRSIKIRFEGKLYIINLSRLNISPPLKVVNKTIIVPGGSFGTIDVTTDFNFTLGDRFIVFIYFLKNDMIVDRREVIVTKGEA